MRTIGLIGGLSWLSTLEYYRDINQGINDRLGSLHSARLLLYSVNFEEFRPDKHTDWDEMTGRMVAIARSLQDAGAECIVICTNTFHKIADAIREQIDISLIHIAKETGKEIKRQSIRTIGLLGTGLVMEQPFIKDHLSQLGITTLVPGKEDRAFIHTSIFTELTSGILLPATKERYNRIIDQLIGQGAEAIVLGCTELRLLIKEEDCPVPLFDSTAIHVRSAINFALDPVTVNKVS